MDEIIVCSKCKKKLRVRTGVVGQTVRCPHCSMVQQLASAEPQVVEPSPDNDERITRQSRNSDRFGRGDDEQNPQEKPRKTSWLAKLAAAWSNILGAFFLLAAAAAFFALVTITGNEPTSFLLGKALTVIFCAALSLLSFCSANCLLRGRGKGLIITYTVLLLLLVGIGVCTGLIEFALRTTPKLLGEAITIIVVGLFFAIGPILNMVALRNPRR